ncbi:hephaestin [Aplochiton taeniatus]
MTGKRSVFGWLFLLVNIVTKAASKEKVYYVGIIEKNWDYAPSGKDVTTGKDIDDDGHASVFLKREPHRIGRVYKKALFREYTDASYTAQAPRPSWLGLLGPVLRAEVDDVIIVHLKNFASRNYSMHPHGVFYEKDAEGALYPDGTSGRWKRDEAVPPGGSYKYRWEVRPEYAPTQDDANCLTWAYHSHLMAPRDISAGLIGPLLTCKKGMLKDPPPSDPERVRSDVDLDVFLFFSVLDEGQSWYLEENIQTFCSDPAGVDLDDPLFQQSNMMHSINGFGFGNLPGIQLCQHRRTAWHLFGMGNEVDVHTASFHGNTLLDRGHRTDSVSLFPATFVTATMVPVATGKWLLSCQVNIHLMAGMQALYEVKSCDNDPDPLSAPPPAGVVRQYYLAAQTLLWDYGPSGQDLVHNRPLTEPDSASEVFFGQEDSRIGGRYKKVVYRAYTDKDFSNQVPVTPETRHLGLLGPVLRAEVGDTIQVEFMNKADRNYSIQPHGLNYDKRFQGTAYQDGVETPGSQVAPGQTFTYTWQVLEGPSSSDPPCIPYLYYSASDPAQDTNSGLVGPLLVCKKGALGKEGVQMDVDKELFLLFSIMDENLSWYLEDNVRSYGNDLMARDNPDFVESNKMHSVNGFLYGNLAGLEICSGDRVVWYTFGLGTETDIHGVYFQGNTFRRQGTTRDTLTVFPHTTVTVEMQPQTVGVFELSCRVGDHYSAGMSQLYKVKSCPGRNASPPPPPPPSRVVRYYVSAEEVEWDYCPDRRWEMEKHMVARPEDSPGDIFVGRGKNRIGPRYRKAVFMEYTDDTFLTRKQRDQQEHMGILGPLIRVEVGEQILITFRNKASRPYSMWPHGVVSSDTHTHVKPGYMTEFRWDVPERSGPGPSDSACISYAYYSNVDFIKDVYSGLLGPLVVCRPGTLRGGGDPADRWRGDVDKEFPLLFLLFNENESWYLDHNIRHYLHTEPTEDLKESSDFLESNNMHGINGLMYGNLKGVTMAQGQRVSWYLIGMGTEVDIHTAHFHAETFTYRTDHVHRADVFDLFPGTFQTLEMVAGTPGTWLLHCHVNDHIHAGMESTFTITERSSSGKL